MQIPSPHPALTHLLASRGVRPHYITGLDSATVALRALAKYLHGQDLPSGGIVPSLAALGAGAINRLPDSRIEQLSTWSGWFDASRPEVLEGVRAESISRWVVSQYPKQRYQAVMIGSSNGAAVHLCAALGIPWLPQTFLISLRRSVDPDQPKQDVEWAKAQAQRLLSHNHDLWLYHMHDANQDRVKIRRVGYFRIKQTRLSESYKQFLQENLAPGATIFLLECQYTWLSTQVGDRHIFQFGGKGGLPPQAYFQDSQQIAEYLQRQGSKHRAWELPDPDGRWPESEWGFEPALREEVEQFAREQGYRIRRIVFFDPQDLSPLVADLYRWWYQQRGLSGDRLLSESFVYLQPWWVLRLGLVPFWTVFNDCCSLARLQHYLANTDPFAEIYLTLFSNGVNSLGLATIEQWRSVLAQARKQGRFVGVDEQKYPRDLASTIRHYTDLKRLEGRYPMPEEPMPLEQLDAFLAELGDRYPVSWRESRPS